MPFDVLDIIYHRSSLSMMSIRRTFVEILEPEDASRRGGSCPPDVSGTRMAAEALLNICHKMNAPLIDEKATSQQACTEWFPFPSFTRPSIHGERKRGSSVLRTLGVGREKWIGERWKGSGG